MCKNKRRNKHLSIESLKPRQNATDSVNRSCCNSLPTWVRGMKVLLLLDEVQWAIFAKWFVYRSWLQWVETLGTSDFKRIVLIHVKSAPLECSISWWNGIEYAMLTMQHLSSFHMSMQRYRKASINLFSRTLLNYAFTELCRLPSYSCYWVLFFLNYLFTEVFPYRTMPCISWTVLVLNYIFSLLI